MKVEIFHNPVNEETDSFHPDFMVIEEKYPQGNMLLNGLVANRLGILRGKNRIGQELDNKIREAVILLEKEQPGKLKEAISGWDKESSMLYFKYFAKIGVKL